MEMDGQPEAVAAFRAGRRRLRRLCSLRGALQVLQVQRARALPTEFTREGGATCDIST